MSILQTAKVKSSRPQRNPQIVHNAKRGFHRHSPVSHRCLWVLSWRSTLVHGTIVERESALTESPN